MARKALVTSRETTNQKFKLHMIMSIQLLRSRNSCLSLALMRSLRESILWLGYALRAVPSAAKIEVARSKT